MGAKHAETPTNGELLTRLHKEFIKIMFKKKKVS